MKVDGFSQWVDTCEPLNIIPLLIDVESQFINHSHVFVFLISLLLSHNLTINLISHMDFNHLTHDK